MGCSVGLVSSARGEVRWRSLRRTGQLSGESFQEANVKCTCRGIAENLSEMFVELSKGRRGSHSASLFVILRCLLVKVDLEQVVGAHKRRWGIQISQPPHARVLTKLENIVQGSGI